MKYRIAPPLAPIALLALSIAATAMETEAESAAHHHAAPPGCTGFRFPVETELALFAAKPTATSAGSTLTASPSTQLRQLYAVSLAEQSKVRFVAQPEKATLDEGSYAGLLRLEAASAGAFRVSLDEAAWVDVIHEGQALSATRFTGGHQCESLRKSVEFQIPARGTVVIQISGSTDQVVQVLFTVPAA